MNLQCILLLNQTINLENKTEYLVMKISSVTVRFIRNCIIKLNIFFILTIAFTWFNNKFLFLCSSPIRHTVYYIILQQKIPRKINISILTCSLCLRTYFCKLTSFAPFSFLEVYEVYDKFVTEFFVLGHLWILRWWNYRDRYWTFQYL